MLETINPKQFMDWLKSNINKTWYLGKNGGFSGKEGSSPFFKYFYISIDTRDMEIFHIGTDLDSVDFRDTEPENAKNILDALNAQFDEKKPCSSSSLERKLQSKFKDLDYDQVKAALHFIKEDCIDELFDRENKDGKDFPWKKKCFSYHDMKQKFEELVNKL